MCMSTQVVFKWLQLLLDKQKANYIYINHHLVRLAMGLAALCDMYVVLKMHHLIPFGCFQL